MPTLTFKAKVNCGEISVPVFTNRHCNMPAWRASRRFGPYADNELFDSILQKLRREIFGPSFTLQVNDPPAGVSVDTSESLALVVVKVADY